MGTYQTSVSEFDKTELNWKMGKKEIKRDMEFVIGATGSTGGVRGAESTETSEHEVELSASRNFVGKDEATKIAKLYEEYRTRLTSDEVARSLGDFTDVLQLDVSPGKIPETYNTELHNPMKSRMNVVCDRLHTNLDGQEWANEVKGASADIFQPAVEAACSAQVNRVLKRLSENKRTHSVRPNLLRRSRMADLYDAKKQSSHIGCCVRASEMGESDCCARELTSSDSEAEHPVEYIGVTRLNNIGRMCDKHWKNRGTANRDALLSRLLEFKYKKMPYTRLQKILRELKVQGYYKSKDIKLMAIQIKELLELQEDAKVPRHLQRSSRW